MIRTAAIIAFVLLPIVAEAESVTYDFSGVVDGQASGLIFSGLAQGAAVSGTFTIDLANGNPAQSQLPISTLSSWSSVESGGSSVGLPVSAGVFSLTATVGSVSYATFSTPGDISSSSSVSGNQFNGGISPRPYNGTEFNRSSNGHYSSSEISIGAMNDSNGLPVLTGGSFVGSVGSLIVGVRDGDESFLDFDIKSVTPAPVPLPATAWMLLSGLGALGALRRRFVG